MVFLFTAFYFDYNKTGFFSWQIFMFQRPLTPWFPAHYLLRTTRLFAPQCAASLKLKLAPSMKSGNNSNTLTVNYGTRRASLACYAPPRLWNTAALV